MKTLLLAITATALNLLAATAGFAADKTETPVAFRAAEGTNAYVSTVANGGLSFSGREVGSRSTFVLIDLNGGGVADGDTVQIKWAPQGAKPTYWREGDGVVNRVGGKPDDACNFKVRLPEKTEKGATGLPKSVRLQTASGKLVSMATKGAALALVETQDGAATLGVTEVPQPVAGEAVAPVAPAVVAAAAASAEPAAPPEGDPRPVLWLIGDSTVKNGTRGQMGWGDPIREYFDPAKIAVSNKARGGRSSRTFLTEGLWDSVLKTMKPGDFVLMQFGHNDGGKIDGGYPNGRASLKGSGDETQEATKGDGTKEVVHTYGWYLRKYIADAKAKGATPVVLSMIPRNDWKEGKVLRASNGYGKWASEAAAAAGVTFIDLNEISATRMEQLGQEAVKAFFPHEHTHTDAAGAEMNARSAVAGIKAVPALELNKYLSAKAADVQPWAPVEGQ